jgi:hypothetical protein
MLSASTLELLESFQEISHATYDQGGLLYTYTEAANQAHFRYPLSQTAATHLSVQELDELGRFIEASQGSYQSESASTRFHSLAQHLIDSLLADLQFNEVAWSFEDGRHYMDASIKMARRVDNRFFSLELMWSVD